MERRARNRPVGSPGRSTGEERTRFWGSGTNDRL